MNIAFGIFVGVFVFLLLKYFELKSSYKFLIRKNIQTENTLSDYFNIINQRNNIVKNKLNISNDIYQSLNNKQEYTVDSILDEIAEKGINNISEDKLNFLKNNNDE
jgi:6-phosphogluconate dehydrogenase